VFYILHACPFIFGIQGLCYFVDILSDMFGGIMENFATIVEFFNIIVYSTIHSTLFTMCVIKGMSSLNLFLDSSKDHFIVYNREY
jgi:hypothetical protein